MLRTFSCLLLTLIGFRAGAAEIGPQPDAATVERARKRLYPGGRDEEDLRVLNRVPEASLKSDRAAVREQVLRSMSGSGAGTATPEAQ